MLTRDKYWELNVCDENFGVWGSQGIEVAVKTWLSGGRVMCNKKTWYAHMFRTQGGDFGFPYPIKFSDQEKAKNFARDLFFNNKWDKQVRPLSWLIEKFWPVPGWTDEDLRKLKANTFKFSGPAQTAKPAESEPLSEESGVVIIYDASQASNPGQTTFNDNQAPSANLQPVINNQAPEAVPTKGIVYYTDHQLKLKIAHKVQRELRRISAEKGIPITCSSIKTMAFGEKSVCLPDLEPGPLTTFKLILNGLENSDSEIVFLCANNVLYHPSHFDFIPTKKGVYYYNQNWWQLKITDGLSVHWDANQVLGLCAYREDLLNFYKKLVADGQKKGHRKKVDRNPGEESAKLTVSWRSEYPNIDIKLEHNFKKYMWSLKDFQNKSEAESFKTTDEILGWGKTKDLIKKLT
jgi:hypothetical protein